MNGASIRFSKCKGMGGADAWRDQLMTTARSSGSGSSRPRTAGTKMPKPDTIHKATVVCVKEYGAFVQLGAGDEFRDGMLHISAMGKDIDRCEDVVKEGMQIWVKVAELNEMDGKYGVDIRYVDQRDGKDLDPYKCKSHKMPDNHMAISRPGNAPAISARGPIFGAGLFSGFAAKQPAATEALDAQPAREARERGQKRKKGAKSSSDDEGLGAPTEEEREKVRTKLDKAAKKLEKLRKKADKAKKKDEKKEKKKAKRKASSSDSNSASAS